MSKANKLKEKVDGDTLDLSLDSLSTVPIKEIAAMKNIKSLDLSCNNIITLPEDFCSLTHLVRLDLSKNGLEQLPVDFGLLSRLQHLDLLGNRLSTLPISMHQMQRLRWLDLKDNCFEESWKNVTGDCLNEKQCMKCAKDVIAYLDSVKVGEDERKEEHMHRMKELDARKQAEECVALEGRRQEKAAEKERRRAAYQQNQREQQKQRGAGDSQDELLHSDEDNARGSGIVLDSKEPARGWGCCTKLVCWLLPLLGSVLAAVVLLLLLHNWCERQPHEQVCQSTAHIVEPLHHQLMAFYKKVKLPNRVFAN